MASPDKQVLEILQDMLQDAIIDKYKHRILNDTDLITEAQAAISQLVVEARLDELRELQMSPRIADELKDQIYLAHIKDRLAALTNKGEQV